MSDEHPRPFHMQVPPRNFFLRVSHTRSTYGGLIIKNRPRLVSVLRSSDLYLLSRCQEQKICGLLANLMHLSMLSPWVGMGGGAGYPRKLTERAFPWVGILTFTCCPRVRNSDKKRYPRDRKLTFSGCLGVGNLTWLQWKCQIPLGLPALGLNIDRCIKIILDFLCSA